MTNKTKTKQEASYSHTVETYTLLNNQVIELPEKNQDVILHPQQYRDLKAKQQEFYFQKRQDIAKRSEPPKIKVLTQAELDDEFFNNQLLEAAKQKELTKQREELEKNAAIQHQAYLASTPLVVQVSSYGLQAFVKECSHRLGQGYSFKECDLHLPSLYAATLIKENINVD
jgi:hypothetical protein